jgi:hypothetical protein
VDATAEIRAFMQAARRMEDKGNLENALELYRQALELAGADPALRSLAREIELTVQDVEKRVAAQPSRPQPAVSPLPPGAPFGEDKGEGVRAEPRRKGGWAWALGGLAGLVVCCVLAAIVYVVNLQQQQAAQATATSAAIQAVRVFGPENGTASIYNLDSRVMVSSGVKLRNFIAEITVYNPPTASWGYAFDFRETYTDHAGFLAVFSDRSWDLTIDDAGRYTTISRGYIENLNVSQNGYNRIRLIALDDTGFFYVNNIFISVLDLSGNLNIGDVILEIYPTATGQIRYTDFTVWRLP